MTDKNSGSCESRFCVLPWIHLATHPHGTVSLCCEADHREGRSLAQNSNASGRQILNLNEHSISEIRNSDYFKKVRLQMLNGEEPLACKGCYDKERVGLESKRTFENRNFSHFDLPTARQITSPNGELDHPLSFVELRLGNLCNLKCRTCNPASSSKWTKEYQQIQESLDFVQKYDPKLCFDWPLEPQFWEDLDQNLSQEATFYINGGEPALNQAHWSFLKKLIDKGKSQQATLIYSINMTVLPDDAIPIWSKFKKVQIRASIDDLDERNHYIRFPSKWNEILKNLKALKESSVELSILQTVSAMNFYYLDEFYAWAKNQSIEVIHNFVTEPHFLAVGALPQEVRLEVLQRLQKGLPDFLFQPLNSLYSQPSDTNHWRRFKKYTQALDSLRNETFADSFPSFHHFLQQRGH